jgi:hypothetical protein
MLMNLGQRDEPSDDHYNLRERKMETLDQQRPHDRSIVRCHIGRALLNRARDPYLAVWKMDFTKREIRDAKRHLLDLNKEMVIEKEVTQILRQEFSFRFVEIADQIQRMGKQGLEGVDRDARKVSSVYPVRRLARACSPRTENS